ncbi:MAG: hypothetical protein JWP01_196 [Myxococcales bacterium]|nr:hypothetical protein [Myxococcales bacterium]
MRHLVLAAVVFCSGCFRGGFPDAAPPRTGVAATGQRLAIVESTETWRQRDNVGEVRVEDEHGQRLATGDVYATRAHFKTTWTAVQGNVKISDEDFFRIAGEPSALEKTQRWRDSNLRSNRLGRKLLLGGFVGGLAGLLLPGIEAKVVVAVAGLSVATCGLHLMMWSHERQQQHVIPVWDAQDIADRYNRKRGISVLRRF